MGQISAIHISEKWAVKIWDLVAIFGSDFHKSAMNSWQGGWSTGGTTNRVSL